MNLDHLRYFRDAADKGSLSAAARTNRVSQSAISQAIRQLESELGCLLITHRRSRFELTSAGLAALKESQAVFQTLDRLRLRATEEEKEARGVLAFGCSGSIATHRVAPILPDFRKDCPRLELRLLLGNSQVTGEWLRAGTIEIGLMIDEKNQPDFQSTVLGRGRYVVFAQPRNPDPGTPGLPGARRRLLVTRSERPEARSLLKVKSTRSLQIAMEVTSWEVIRSMVLSDPHLAGLCPDYVIEREVREGRLKLSPIPGWRHDYALQLVHLKGHRLSPGARLLIQRMQKV